MAVYPNDIITRFPNFVDENPVRIQLFITDAEQSVNRTVWGKKADLGIIYLTAHLLAISPSPDISGGSGSVGGVVTSEKVGDLSRNYSTTTAPSSASNAALSSTRYGLEFIRLRREVLTSPAVITQSGSIYG